MGAEHQHGAVGNLRNRFDEDRSAPAELFHHIGVVNDLMVDVHRSAIRFHFAINYVYLPNHTRAKTPGTYAKQDLSFSLCRHLVPKLLNFQNTIIPKPSFPCMRAPLDQINRSYWHLGQFPAPHFAVKMPYSSVRVSYGRRTKPAPQ